MVQKHKGLFYLLVNGLDEIQKILQSTELCEVMLDIGYVCV